MTNKQIFDAQKVLTKLQGTPVRLYNQSGQSFWQVTYDNETYNLLLGVVTAVAELPIRSISTFPDEQDYRRERI